MRDQVYHIESDGMAPRSFGLEPEHKQVGYLKVV